MFESTAFTQLLGEGNIGCEKHKRAGRIRE
jgi:hypothetical protein